MRELPSGHTADDGVHAPATRRIGTGVGQPGRALRQRGLHPLTLHLLHPVALLTDLGPQSGNTEKRESKSDAVTTRSCIHGHEDGIFTWRRDRLTLSPIVSWKKKNIASINCILVWFFFNFPLSNVQSTTLWRQRQHSFIKSPHLAGYMLPLSDLFLSLFTHLQVIRHRACLVCYINPCKTSG